MLSKNLKSQQPHLIKIRRIQTSRFSTIADLKVKIVLSIEQDSNNHINPDNMKIFHHTNFHKKSKEYFEMLIAYFNNQKITLESTELNDPNLLIKDIERAKGDLLIIDIDGDSINLRTHEKACSSCIRSLTTDFISCPNCDYVILLN